MLNQTYNYGVKSNLIMAKYIVKVLFTKSRPNCAIGTRMSSYFKGQGRTDEFVFMKNGFVLNADRSAIYVDGKILTNSQKSLSKQIMKGLLVYYALASDFPKLKSIEIVRKRPSKIGDFVYTETAGFLQPLMSKVPRTLHLDSTDINAILDESDKGETIRIALSYWLKALNSNDVYFKFDRLWRAYDRLLLYQGNNTNEREGIRAMKRLIVAHAAVFPQSTSLTNTYCYEYIRKFRWNKLLYSKSGKYSKPKEIARLAKEYTDKRAVQLYKDLIGGDTVHAILVSSGEYADVEQHLNINAATENNIDIVLLMSLTYTYHIRCKMYHGEVPDSTFKLKETDEDWEVPQLVTLLELVVYELLNSNHILR